MSTQTISIKFFLTCDQQYYSLTVSKSNTVYDTFQSMIAIKPQYKMKIKVLGMSISGTRILPEASFEQIEAQNLQLSDPIFVISDFISHELMLYFTTDEVNRRTRIVGKDFWERERKKVELYILEDNKMVDGYEYVFKKKGEHVVAMKLKEMVVNFGCLFYNCIDLVSVDGGLDTSNAKNFSWLFGNCISLRNILGISEWDMSKGTNFSCAFYNCKKLNNLNGLELWNVGRGTNFSYMFMNCVLLKEVDALKDWDLKEGLNFSFMFKNCSSLSSLNGLGLWKVSKGTAFSEMFSGCKNIENLNLLKNWDVSQGKSFKGMFSNCMVLENLRGIETWNTGNGRDFNAMFFECSEIKNVDELKLWKVENGRDFRFMFYGCGLENVGGLSDWNVENGNRFDCMFDNRKKKYEITENLRNKGFVNGDFPLIGKLDYI